MVIKILINNEDSNCQPFVRWSGRQMRDEYQRLLNIHFYQYEDGRIFLDEKWFNK